MSFISLNVLCFLFYFAEYGTTMVLSDTGAICGRQMRQSHTNGDRLWPSGVCVILLFVLNEAVCLSRTILVTENRLSSEGGEQVD